MPGQIVSYNHTLMRNVHGANTGSTISKHIYFISISMPAWSHIQLLKFVFRNQCFDRLEYTFPVSVTTICILQAIHNVAALTVTMPAFGISVLVHWMIKYISTSALYVDIWYKFELLVSRLSFAFRNLYYVFSSTAIATELWVNSLWLSDAIWRPRSGSSLPDSAKPLSELMLTYH